MFSFFKYFGISEKNDIFDFTCWHQFSASQLGWKSTIFISFACCIYWAQKSCNTTNLLHKFFLSKKHSYRKIGLIQLFRGEQKEGVLQRVRGSVKRMVILTMCHMSEFQNILDSNNVRIDLSIYVKFSLGKWLSTRQKNYSNRTKNSKSQ